MKQLPARLICWPFLVTCLVVTLLFACAAPPPRQTQPVTDLKTIAGYWEGFGRHITAGQFFMKLLIKGNGQWEMVTQPPVYGVGTTSFFIGRVMVDEDKLYFDGEARVGVSGTGIIQIWGGSRWLVFESNDGSMKVELRRSGF